jgi:hypothetical protein
VNNDANSEATSVPHAAANTDPPDGNADALQCTTVNLAAVTGAPPHQMDKCAVRGCPKFPNPPCLMDICSFVSTANLFIPSVMLILSANCRAERLQGSLLKKYRFALPHTMTCMPRHLVK